MKNVRQKMNDIAEWLGYQHESLSFGLRSVTDAEKLYDHWQANEATLPEYADEDDSDLAQLLASERVAALGYDPLEVR